MDFTELKQQRHYIGCHFLKHLKAGKKLMCLSFVSIVSVWLIGSLKCKYKLRTSKTESFILRKRFRFENKWIIMLGDDLEISVQYCVLRVQYNLAVSKVEWKAESSSFTGFSCGTNFLHQFRQLDFFLSFFIKSVWLGWPWAILLAIAC